MLDEKSLNYNNFYSEKYVDENWCQLRLKDAKHLLDKISKLDIFNKKSIVLDAGCGSGELGSEIISKYNSDVYGVDLNTFAVEHTRRLGVKAKIMDLDKRWVFEDSKFSVVLGTEIIEHILDTDHFIKEARRVLDPGGTIIITTPNLSAWFNRVIFPLGYQPFFTEVSTLDKTIGLNFTRKLTENREPVGHIRVFACRALIDFLNFHGFEVEFICGQKVLYLPKYIKVIDDILFSNIPSWASEIIVVAKKSC